MDHSSPTAQLELSGTVSATTVRASQFCNAAGVCVDPASLVPTGAVMAFDLASCPAGWSEYTASRGRFLRGIDNGAGNDPDGTRAPGATQADALQNITGSFGEFYGGAEVGDAAGAFASYGSTTGAVGNNAITPKADGYNFDASRVVRTSNETRPKNVAILYCRKN